MRNILPEEKKRRITLSELLDDSVVDTVRSSKESDEVYESSTVTEDIVDNTPSLDIGKNLSFTSREVMEESGNIARSFNRYMILAPDLLSALIKDEYVRNKLESRDVAVGDLEKAINEEAEKGNLDNASLREKDTVLSKEVEYTVKDSLKILSDERSAYIEPTHILVTLLKKGYPSVDNIMHKVGLDRAVLVRSFENEDN